MRAHSRERVLTTVLFTDIVGSTELATEVGDKVWHELLARHHAIVRHELKRFGGREVDTAGDGFFAIFPKPAQAVRCAFAVTGAVRELGIELRAGLHTGEVQLAGKRVEGVAVHAGARVAALAGPGEVVVTRTVKDLVTGSKIGFSDRGAHTLKGLDGEWDLFDVVTVDGKAGQPVLDPHEAFARREAIQPRLLSGQRRVVAVGVALAMAAAVVAVFVARSGDPETRDRPVDTVLRIDAETGNLIPTTTGALGIRSFRVAHPRIAVGEGGVWVYDFLGGRIFHLNPRTGAVENTVRLPGSFAVGVTPDLAVGAQAVWATSAFLLGDQNRGAIVRINPATDELLPTLRFPEAEPATGVAVVPGSVWGAFAGGSVIGVDPATNRTLATLELPAADLIAAGKSAIWVGDLLASSITRIDLETYEVGQPIELTSGVTELAVGEGKVWVLDSVAGTVTPVDPVTLHIGQGIRVGENPVDIAVRLGAVWVAGEDGKVWRIDPSISSGNPTVVADVGAPISGLAIDEDHGSIWLVIPPA